MHVYKITPSFLALLILTFFFLSVVSPVAAQTREITILELSYLPTAPCYQLSNPLSPAGAVVSGSINGFTPHGAFDGNIAGTKWAIYNPPYKDSYLLIDLQRVQNISGISLYFWLQDRPESYRVLLSATGQFQGEEVAAVLENSGLSGYQSYVLGGPIVKRNYFVSPTNARYIKFVVDVYRNGQPETSGQINLYELELYQSAQQKECLDYQTIGDIAIPSDPGASDPLGAIRNQIQTNTANMIVKLQEASQYHGYKNAQSPQDISYRVIDKKEFLEKIPASPYFIPRPDYMTILNQINICNYVDNLGVRQVWMWGYHNERIIPPIAPDESNMAMGRKAQAVWNMPQSFPTSKFFSSQTATYGDISNSSQVNDMPVCENTYVLFNYAYDTSISNPTHNHLHQIENVLGYADREMFWDMYTGRQYSFAGPRRCGHSHTAPNANGDYQYQSTAFVVSDCEDWVPENCINKSVDAACGGTRTSINCNRWNCNEFDYYTWWMQNLPGKNNMLTYGGLPLRNFWDAIYDFDQFFLESKSLTLIQPTATPPPFPTPIVCASQRQGDIDCSGVVTFIDLSWFLPNFGKKTNPGEPERLFDLDDSGGVTILDLSILLSNFGRSL